MKLFADNQNRHLKLGSCTSLKLDWINRFNLYHYSLKLPPTLLSVNFWIRDHQQIWKRNHIVVDQQLSLEKKLLTFTLNVIQPDKVDIAAVFDNKKRTEIAMCYFWSLHYSTASAVAAGAWHCIWTKDNLDFMPTNTIRKLNREVFCLELLKTNELIRLGIKLTSVYLVSWLFLGDAILCNLSRKQTSISNASIYFEEQWL